MSWKPVLDGADAAAAHAAIDDIAAELGQREVTGGGMADGNAGVALLHYYRALSGAADAADVAVAALVAALEAPREEIDPWLLSGLPGVVWTMEHLAEVVEPEPEVSGPVDALLDRLLATTPWPHPWEFMVGLTGLGAYALGPGRAALLDQVVARLAELAVEDRGGLTWPADPDLLGVELRPGERYVNLGLAHGVVGVIAMLAEATAAGARGAATLLDGAVPWLLGHELGAGPARFPLELGSDRGLRAMTGWCYGDQAVAAALVRAGQVRGRADWLARGRDVALDVARRSVDPAGDLDTGLCHGTVSRAHMFNRLGQATGEAALLEAARAAYRATLARRAPGQGLAGFGAVANAPGRAPAEHSLLTGATGVALALLGAVSEVEPAWDRAFLVALPPL